MPLCPDELFGCDPVSVRTLAAAPRPLLRTQAAGLLPLGDVRPAPLLVERFRKARRALQRSRGPHPYRFAHPDGDPTASLWPARLALWQSHIEPGNRNNVAIRLACAFRLRGLSEASTLQLLLQRNEERRIRLPETELRRVVRSAFARPFPYTYGCRDELIRQYCPYGDQLAECAEYRSQNPRTAA